MNISKNFIFNELTHTNHSKYLIRNRNEGRLYIPNLRVLCNYVLEPVRELIGKPIIVNSAFRCLSLNRFIGSKDTSQHLDGYAGDIKFADFDLKTAFDKICLSNVKWGQLIFETKNNSKWIHISVANLSNNGQILIYENGTYWRIK